MAPDKGGGDSYSVAEVPPWVDRLGADRQIRGACTLRRDLTITGKHESGSYLRRAILAKTDKANVKPGRSPDAPDRKLPAAFSSQTAAL